MESLAPVAATVGVLVSVVEPGPVATEFVNNVGVDVAKIFAEAGEYEPAMHAYLRHIMAEFADPEAAQTADQVAEVVLNAITTDSPAFRHQTSHWARTFAGYKLSDHDGSAVVGMTEGWLRGD
jgi:NAD(P)-dependent dehydrogenase (short-subunit alcohol dehydrogenase family)